MYSQQTPFRKDEAFHASFLPFSKTRPDPKERKKTLSFDSIRPKPYALTPALTPVSIHMLSRRRRSRRHPDRILELQIRIYVREDGAFVSGYFDVDAVCRLHVKHMPPWLASHSSICDLHTLFFLPSSLPTQHNTTQPGHQTITHLRYPPLHQKHLETHRREPLYGRAAPHPVLLHVRPLAEVVFDDEDGFGFPAEVGGDV